MVPGGKFRTIETLRIRGMEFEEQANLIIGMLTRYNVQHMGSMAPVLVKRFISWLKSISRQRFVTSSHRPASACSC
jgi:hypothetical protein